MAGMAAARYAGPVRSPAPGNGSPGGADLLAADQLSAGSARRLSGPGRAAQHLAAEEDALRRLVLHCDDSDPVARVVVERVVPRLMAFVRRRFSVLTEDDAYDIAAEALTIAIERRAAFDLARTAKVRTWLYGIAQIRAADFLRKRGQLVPIVEDGDGWSIERERKGDRNPSGSPDGSSSGTAVQLVRAALFALPEQQRKAAIARYVEGLPPDEIDRAYRWKPNTAHVYLSLARKAIRRRLAGAGLPPGSTAERG